MDKENTNVNKSIHNKQKYEMMIGLDKMLGENQV